MSAKIRADFENPQFNEFETKLSKKKTEKKKAKINVNIGSSDDIYEESSSSSSDEDLTKWFRTIET